MKNISILAGIIFLFFCVSFLNAQTGCDFFVATNGNDSNPGTSESNAFRTIARGVNALGAGDTLCVKSGTYREKLSISKTGTSSNPVIIKGYGPSLPIIDGNNNLPDPDCRRKDTSGSGRDGCIYQPLVRIRDSSHLEFRNFEIKGSTGRGLIVHRGSDLLVSGVDIHHSYNIGFLSEDTNRLIIRDSRVWQTIRAQPEEGKIGGSAFTIKFSHNSLALRNLVFNNWGEGLNCLRTDTCTLKHNIIWDNYHTNMYLDNAADSTADGNAVFCTDDRRFWRRLNNSSLRRPERGITVEDEVYPEGAGGKNRTVINNIVVGCGFNIVSRHTHPDSGLKNALIANNTLVESRGDAGSNFAGMIVRDGKHTNSLIANNIIIQSQGDVIRGGGLSNSNINFRNNLYSKAPASNHPGGNSYFTSPASQIIQSLAWVSQEEIIPDRNVFARYGPKAGSPAINAGASVGVSEDFFEKSRGSGIDIGALEFGTVSNTSTPTDIPTQKTDLDADGDTDFLDFTILLANIGDVGNEPWDLEEDGVIDIFDYNVLVREY